MERAGQLFRRESYVFEKIKRLFQPVRDHKISPRVELGYEELKYRRLLHMLIEVALQHHKLVMVSQKGIGKGIHAEIASKWMETAPRRSISSSACRPSFEFELVARTASARMKGRVAKLQGSFHGIEHTVLRSEPSDKYAPDTERFQ